MDTITYIKLKNDILHSILDNHKLNNTSSNNNKKIKF